MRNLITIIMLVLAVAACGPGRDDAQAQRERCLYAAVHAYPSWPQKATRPVLDSIKECRGLQQDDRDDLRGLMAEFVAAANDATATPPRS